MAKSGDVFQPMHVAGSLDDERFDLEDLRNPSGNPDYIVNQQCRGDIYPVIYHLAAVAVKVNLGLDTQFVKCLAHVVESPLAARFVFRLAKDVDPHGVFLSSNN
jgi:hypothetical protein